MTQDQGQAVDPAGRYRLEERIATGGMGEVWRGTDTVLSRSVAVKLLKAEYADDQLFRTRFQTEAQHAAALHHPGVAAVYDFGGLEGTGGPAGGGVGVPYLVMELVEGQPLSALLRPSAPMAPAVVSDLMAQAADAIGAAHAAGIVHRDVKPGNLLVTPDRQVKITDFGIARAADSMALTQTGQVMGTPQYLSPEQARGNAATPASDVYSLACVAYECLAGRRPFVAETPVATALAHIREPVPELPASVPADLAAVVRRGLAKEAAERFPDGRTFAAAFRDPSRYAGAADAPTAVVPTAAADDSTRVLGGAALGGAALAGAGVGAAGGAALGRAVAATPADGTATSSALAGGPEEDGRDRRALWITFAVAALVALVAALAFTLVGGDDQPQEETTTAAPTSRTTEPSQPTTSATTDDTTIELDPDDYQGRPYDDVAAALRELGLQPQRDEVTNPGDQEPGTVEDINPSGAVEPGEVITVTVFGELPEEDPTTQDTEPSDPQTEETQPTEPTEPTQPTEPTEPTDADTTPALTTPTSPGAAPQG